MLYYLKKQIWLRAKHMGVFVLNPELVGEEPLSQIENQKNKNN